MCVCACGCIILIWPIFLRKSYLLRSSITSITIIIIIIPNWQLNLYKWNSGTFMGLMSLYANPLRFLMYFLWSQQCVSQSETTIELHTLYYFNETKPQCHNTQPGNMAKVHFVYKTIVNEHTCWKMAIFIFVSGGSIDILLKRDFFGP